MTPTRVRVGWCFILPAVLAVVAVYVGAAASGGSRIKEAHPNVSVDGISPLPLEVESEAGYRETMRDRLWIWGHPVGVYNESYLARLGRKSTIEPVAAADDMGLRNMIFVRYDAKPKPPFDEYYAPFTKLRAVYWSLVGAGGETSDEEREHAYRLAEANPNVCGFMLDDFFHEPTVRGERQPCDNWLAQANARFPVTVTLTASGPRKAEWIELAQSDWHSGDYRSKDFEVEVSRDGREFAPAANGLVPNEPRGTARVTLPNGPFAAIRIRILSTHDTKGAMSCGLSRVYLRYGNEDDRRWKAEASSNTPGFDAAALIGVSRPFRASLAPEQLHALGERKVRGGKLPIMAVVYTGQIWPRARRHLNEVAEVCMWTWRPAQLDDLEENLAALEQLIPGKPIYLGCYMYDFEASRPLPVELMKMQTEIGYRWLKHGRIRGMIFLATPNVDVGLEAVDWTRKWIATVGDEPLVQR